MLARSGCKDLAASCKALLSLQDTVAFSVYTCNPSRMRRVDVAARKKNVVRNPAMRKPMGTNSGP